MQVPLRLHAGNAEGVVIVAEDGNVTREGWIEHGLETVLENKTYVKRAKSSIVTDLKFIYSLKEVELRDELGAIDRLYNYVDTLIERDAFFRIDRIINFIINKEFKLRILIGLLTITHVKRNFLNNRTELIEFAKTSALSQGLNEKQIQSIIKGF